ncbi:hypothetical protein GQ600_1182 [Phytophthora cactorum]|nr:hypothetical protein GQ600_1182 [Phytophthora cactorum]
MGIRIYSCLPHLLSTEKKALLDKLDQVPQTRDCRAPKASNCVLTGCGARRTLNHFQHADLHLENRSRRSSPSNVLSSRPTGSCDSDILLLLCVGDGSSSKLPVSHGTDWNY